jgi:hypothetical protein
MYYDTKEATMTNKFTSIIGHFDGHGSARERYRQHRPMRHVQGYSQSHWTPPSDNYSLCITPAAARVTANDTKMKKWTNFDGRFDGRGGAPVQYRVCVCVSWSPVKGVQVVRHAIPIANSCPR